jgi:hypothetical protein
MSKTIEYEDNGKGGYSPKKKKGKAIGHFLFAPINGISNSFKWVTDSTSKGGGQYVMHMFAILCLALSTESMYQWFAGDQAAKFLPKPGVNDGAQISRVLPLGDVLNGAIGFATDAVNLAGADIEKPRPFQKTDLIVWADGRFYLALVAAIGINVIEAIVIRKVSLSLRKRQLKNSQQKDKEIGEVVNSFKEAAQEFKSLETSVREHQLKNHGNGKYILLGTAILACYLIEFLGFRGSVPKSTPFALATILGLASVFGAEGFWGLADYLETRETEDN